MKKILLIALIFAVSNFLFACGRGELPAIDLTAEIEFYDSFTSDRSEDYVFDVNDEVYVKMNFQIENPHDERHQIKYEINVPDAEDVFIDPTQRPADIQMAEGDVRDENNRRITKYEGSFTAGSEKISESPDIWFVFRGLRNTESNITLTFSSESADILGKAQNGITRTLTFERNNLEEIDIELSNIQFDKNSERLTWSILNESLISSNYAYAIELNRTDEPSLITEDDNYNQDYFDLSQLSAGEYRFEITALSTDVLENNVFDSNMKSISFTRLKTPNIIFIDGAADWDDIPSADGYTINVDTQPFYASESFLVLDFLPAGNHSIFVQATSTDGRVLNSMPSSPKSVFKLDAPFIEQLSLGRITWNALNNVSRYKIFIDGVLHTETTQTSFDLIAGTYSITVVAHSTANNIIDSDPSNTIEIDIGG